VALLRAFIMKPIFFLCSLFLACRLGAADVPIPPVSVSSVVEEIVRQNPERRFYREAIRAAQADAKLAGQLGDPELSFDLGHKRVRTAANQLAGEGAAWSVSVTQTFAWPGRLALRKALANHDVSLAELGLQRFDLALAARARLLAQGLYAAHARAVAIREVADRFADLKSTLLARDPAGITPQLEARVIEAAELSLQRRATDAELAVQAALLELNQLRGAALDAPLRVSTPALSFNPAPATDALLAAARANNFDYATRRVELAQQADAVSLARHQRRPGVSVSPFFSQENAGDRETVVGIGFSLPLPLPGRTGATLAAAESRRRQAEVALLVAQRELDRDVLTAAQTYVTKRAEIQRWSPDTLDQFRDAAALADRHYRLGAVPIATYVELQSSYLDAVEALLDTQRETLAASLTLQELTGLDFNPIPASQP
jgi:cobalt-zinc-cadmium efflux system outer membrane protein